MFKVFSQPSFISGVCEWSVYYGLLSGRIILKIKQPKTNHIHICINNGGCGVFFSIIVQVEKFSNNDLFSEFFA